MDIPSLKVYTRTLLFTNISVLLFIMHPHNTHTHVITNTHATMHALKLFKALNWYSSVSRVIHFKFCTHSLTLALQHTHMAHTHIHTCTHTHAHTHSQQHSTQCRHPLQRHYHTPSPSPSSSHLHLHHLHPLLILLLSVQYPFQRPFQFRFKSPFHDGKIDFPNHPGHIQKQNNAHSDNMHSSIMPSQLGH